MEIDLLKPLVAKFKMRRRVKRLEYEGLHLIYFDCGLYGHSRESYPLEKSEMSTVTPQKPGGQLNNCQPTEISVDSVYPGTHAV